MTSWSLWSGVCDALSLFGDLSWHHIYIHTYRRTFTHVQEQYKNIHMFQESGTYICFKRVHSSAFPLTEIPLLRQLPGAAAAGHHHENFGCADRGPSTSKAGQVWAYLKFG